MIKLRILFRSCPERYLLSLSLFLMLLLRYVIPVRHIAYADKQDYAMVCLVDSFEVICFHHDVNFKIV
jgi:hypothetical protein